MRGIGACYVFLFVGLSPASAQVRSGALDQVAWTIQAEPSVARRGQALRIVFRADLGEADPEAGPWKMYGLGSPPPSRAVRITFAEYPEGLQRSANMQQSGATEGYDKYFDKNVIYFERQALLWADFEVDEAAVPGSAEVRGEIDFMICNERLCLPPATLPYALTIRVREADGSASKLSAAPLGADPTGAPRFFTDTLGLSEQVSVTDSPAQAAPVVAAKSATGFGGGGGLWAFLLLAVGAGLGAFLMPCVYPMIPLTVSYFTKHADRPSGSVRMALVYGLAIVATFTGLGVVLAALVKGAGAQSVAANPWVNLSIGAVFIVFALSLLGLFELRLPSRLVNYFSRRGAESKGYLGVLFMGFALTLVSFSCTVPFVGLLLPAIANGVWFYGVLGMFVFSLTFSLPFVGFALFPRALGALPNAGHWMHVMKVVFGFVELAAALKFLSNADIVWGLDIISRTLAIAVCTVLFALTGLYLIGKLRLRHAPAEAQIGVGRLLSSVVFFGLALYLIPGLLGAPLNKLDAYLPPRQSDDVSLVALFGDDSLAQDEAWITDDIEAAFSEAGASAKPVMIDFTGYTCTNCREMEANVFTREEIARRFEQNFVLLRLFTDGPRDREFQKYQLNLTGTVALPTYAIVDAKRQQTPLVQISGVLSAERFAAFLDQGAASFVD